ncbi:MAG TPA: efflux RND transporter permease subunit, partial [Planctomycetota bacterium]|nr:efflux RND transporter permease subunit [Planctomycetota bacterium]
RPLEENLAVVAGLSSYRSVSRAGTSDVVLEFEWDTPMTFAAQDVREKVDQLLPRLPRGVERPLLLRYDPAFDPVLRLGFYGAADLYRLRDYGENEIKRRLETIPGVAAVKIKGGYEKEIRVELKERLLRAEKVSPELVNQRLQAENVNVPGGVLRDGDVEYLVRTLNEFRSPEEIGELVVTQQGGRAVRLKDLGEVRVGHKERDVVTRIDGAESVEIEIYKEADANLTAVAQAVKERLFGADWRRTLVDGDYAPPPATPPAPTADGRPGDKSERKPLAALLPSGMRLKVLSDQSTFIEGSLREVNEGAFQGALLATLVLFAFLRRLKPTLIIAVAIPVSIVATFAPLYLAGVSLNIMSLGGLALGVGMLVDNSIVVLEAVTRRREAGEGVFAAAVNGAREMSAAVFGSTLTTVVVFLPIVFVEGSAGQIFRDQALAVVFSLLASLAAALVLVPMLAALDVPTGAADVGRRRRALAALRRYGRPTRWPSVRGFRRDRGLRRWALLPWRLAQVPFDAASRLLFFAAALPAAGVAWVVAKFGRALGFVLRPPLRLFDLGFSFVQRAVAATLAGALRARLLTLAIVGVLGAAAAIAYGGLRQDLLPAVRQGLFYVEIQFDVGTPVERTDARALALESVARDALARAGVVPASVSLVSGTPRDAQAKPGDGSHTTRLWFRLRIGDGRVAEVEDRARAAVLAAFEAVPGVGAPVVDAPQLFRASQPLEVEITGADPARLREAAEILERETARLPGVTGVRSTVRRGRPEIVVRPDREALARYDLKLGDVAAVVRAKVQGEVATRFSENDRRIEVRTRLPEDETASAAAVSQLQVNPGRTPPIPLSAVATVETSAGPAEIRHVGGRRAEIVAADLAGLDLRGAADALAAIVRRAEAAR